MEKKGVRVPGFAVLNKCDCLGDAVGGDHPPYETAVCISAKEGTGIDALAAAVRDALEVDTLGPDEPIVFTQRQRRGQRGRPQYRRRLQRPERRACAGCRCQ